jgi:hypothetical protein
MIEVVIDNPFYILNQTKIPSCSPEVIPPNLETIITLSQ